MRVKSHLLRSDGFSPHLCVGFLFFILYPRASASASSASSFTTLSTTIFHTHLCQPPSFTHNCVNHHLSHTSLSTTIFHTHLLSTTIFHTQLCQPPSFTRNFVNHHLSHTTLSNTIFHRQLCQPPSFTHIFVNHHLSHTTLSTTIFQTAAALCVAGVALVTSIFVSRGAWLALVARLGWDWSPVTPRHFAWQAWRLVTSLRFTWQAWHLVTSTSVSRGRRALWRHLPSFCLAGVALKLGWLRWRGLGWDWSPVTPRHFAWQAWRLETSTFPEHRLLILFKVDVDLIESSFFSIYLIEVIEICIN